MSKLIDMTNELYKARNMVNYLNRKFQVDTKQPITVSDSLNAIRVSVSLEKTLNDFLNANVNLQIYAKRLRLNLEDLNSFLAEINTRFTESDESNLSSKQKDFVVTQMEAIDNAVLNMAGRIYFSLDEINALVQLTTEQREFLDIAKEVHYNDEHTINTKYRKKEILSSEKGIPIEEIQDIDIEEEDSFTLSLEDDEGEVTPIISEDINK